MYPNSSISYSFLVVSQQRLYRLQEVLTLVCSSHVKSQVYAVYVAVKKESLSGIEGEPFQEEPEAMKFFFFRGILLNFGKFICDSECKHFISFSGKSGIYDAEEGKDALCVRWYLLRKESELAEAE